MNKEKIEINSQGQLDWDKQMERAQQDVKAAEDQLRAAQGQQQYREALINRDSKNKILKAVELSEPSTAEQLRREVKYLEQKLMDPKYVLKVSDILSAIDEKRKQIFRLENHE